MKTLKGNLSLSRGTVGGVTAPCVTITLEDTDARVQAIEIRVESAAFLDALLGRSFVACEFDFNDSGLIGKKREHKTEAVYVPDLLGVKEPFRQQLVREALSSHERNGWIGRQEDCTNPHNWQRNLLLPDGKIDGYIVSVVFERWV